MQHDMTATTLFALIIPFVASKGMLTEAERSIARYSGCQ